MKARADAVDQKSRHKWMAVTRDDDRSSAGGRPMRKNLDWRRSWRPIQADEDQVVRLQ